MKEVFITKIRAASAEEWDKIWHTCEYSTFFHSREWAEIWRTYSHRAINPKPLLFFFSDGTQALLPLSTQKICKGLASCHLSSPGGTFGGWITSDELHEAHSRLLAHYMTHKLGNLTWRLNPYAPHSTHLTFPDCIGDETQVLELSEGFETIHRRWSKGHIAAAHKAKREGVTIRLASCARDWSDYFEVYQSALKRWGEQASSRYNWELFETMERRHSPAIRLWLACYENKIVSGALCFYARRHAVYWHGASFAAFFELHPAHLIFYEAIRDACDQGYFWFDFNPSGGHEGVRIFKGRFRATAIKSPVLITQGVAARSLQKMCSWWKSVFSGETYR
jgi:hypothetical protein